MKRLVVVGLGLCLCLIPPMTHAQGGEPRWLAPADVFTDAVEVIEALPFLSADNEARLLYYSAGTSSGPRAYPYPDSFEPIEDIRHYVRRRTDGTYVINPGGFGGFRQDLADEVWIFDPVTGDIYHPESACGWMRALPGEGHWIIYLNPETDQYHLCFTETGELSAPLPEEMQSDVCGVYYWQRQPTASPDGSRVVFADCAHPEFSLYAYEVATSQVWHLGGGLESRNENVRVVRWIDNTHPVIHVDSMQSYTTHSVYFADVTQSGSLELIFSQYSWYFFWPPYYENPPRYEWVPGEYVTGSPGVPDDWCQIHVYDLETQELTIYPEIPGICGVGVLIPDDSGDRLYRRPDWSQDARTDMATLVRFIPATGEYQELFTGEIERLLGVSPGGRYAVLGMDNDGFLPLFADRGPFDWGSPTSPGLAILSLETHEVVYEVMGHLWPPGDPSRLSPEITWLDDHAFLLTDALDVEFDEAYNATYSYEWRLVELDGEQVTETPVDDPAPLLSDRRYILREEERPDDLLTLSVYDTETEETTPVIRDLDAERYEAILDWQGDDSLLVRVVDGQRDNFFTLGYWHVRVVP